MGLVALACLDAGAFLGLAMLTLRGGRGDRGDGVRRVVLPPPSSHLGRVAVLATSVLAAGALLIAENGLLKKLIQPCIATLLRGAGLGPARVAAYAPQVYPLLGTFLVVSLALFHLVRRGSPRSLAIGLALTAATGLAVLLTAATVDAAAALAGVPAVAAVYLVNVSSLFVGLFGFMAGLFRASMLPCRYRHRAVVGGLGSGVLLTALAVVAVLAGAAGFRVITGAIQPVFPGSALLVFLIVPITLNFVQVLLFTFRRKERPGVPPRPDPPLDIIMPAWNEEEQILAVLRALDRAAAHYPGPVRVIVSDDGSTDRTVARAAAAAREATTADIVVLPGTHGGKASALNRALEFATAGIVVRVDADILVHPGVLLPLPGWFANPNVGCVGAFNLPNLDLPAWYTKGRLFECLYTFGFARLAYERLDANNIPGMYMAFRRTAALALGGFVDGMNGEDSDLTFNLGRLGLMSVIDPRIVIYEDVPQNLRSFIEQRTRWSRASIHVAARHLPRHHNEYTARFAIQLHFVYSKLAALMRPVTYLAGAALVISDGRAGDLMLRGLMLLAVGFVPQFGLLVILAMTYRFGRELPWLVVWLPFTIARKIGLLNGIVSIPSFRRVRGAEPGRASPRRASSRRARPRRARPRRLGVPA